MADLSLVRRLEAVSFQSFPAGSTYYDGTWAVRLTKNHTAKRLNSVNALDPRDTHDLETRLDTVRARFEHYGKMLVFRKSPLMPECLGELFVSQGWQEFDETIIMTRDLADHIGRTAPDIAPQEDVAHWVDAAISLGEEHPANRERLIDLLEGMIIPTGLFLLEDANSNPASAGRCVVNRDMVGVFELATRKDLRGQGLARSLVRACLVFGVQNLAKTAWLQVVADNEAALGLYRSLGFVERYRYSYWTPDHG